MDIRNYFRSLYNLSQKSLFTTTKKLTSSRDDSFSEGNVLTELDKVSKNIFNHELKTTRLKKNTREAPIQINKEMLGYT